MATEKLNAVRTRQQNLVFPTPGAFLSTFFSSCWLHITIYVYLCIYNKIYVIYICTYMPYMYHIYIYTHVYLYAVHISYQQYMAE